MIKDCEAYKLSVILGTDKKFFMISLNTKENTHGENVNGLLCLTTSSIMAMATF